jgi:hypothetical protein
MKILNSFKHIAVFYLVTTIISCGKSENKNAVEREEYNTYLINREILNSQIDSIEKLKFSIFPIKVILPNGEYSYPYMIASSIEGGLFNKYTILYESNSQYLFNTIWSDNFHIVVDSSVKQPFYTNKIDKLPLINFEEITKEDIIKTIPGNTKSGTYYFTVPDIDFLSIYFRDENRSNKK